MAAAGRLVRRARRRAAARRRRPSGSTPRGASSQLAGGERLRYDDLLIATGAEPGGCRRSPRFANVQTLRTLEDAVRLRAVLSAGAAAHRRRRRADRPRGRRERPPDRRSAVDVVEAAPVPMRGLPRSRGALAALRRSALHRGRSARGSSRRAETGLGGRHSAGPLRRAPPGHRVEELVLADGSRVGHATMLVEAVGVRPATGWLAGRGSTRAACATGEGGRTALPHVYAAGDAAHVTRSGRHSREAAAPPRAGAGVARALLGLARRARRRRLVLERPARHAPAAASATRRRRGRVSHGDAAGRGFEIVHRREGRVSAVLLAGRSAADLRAARRRVTPAPELERSAA